MLYFLVQMSPAAKGMHFLEGLSSYECWGMNGLWKPPKNLLCNDFCHGESCSDWSSRQKN